MAAKKTVDADETVAEVAGEDGAELKKTELIDRVVERSGVKKKDVKPVVEALLAVMGEALSDGKALSLQPLGKLKVTRTKDLKGGQMMVARLRRPKPGNAGTEALETSADEG